MISPRFPWGPLSQGEETCPVQGFQEIAFPRQQSVPVTPRKKLEVCMVRSLTVVTVFFYCATAFAQLPDDRLDVPTRAHVHSHASDGLIDGSQHPELIPDAVAYRLFLLGISEPPNAPEQRKPRQLAFLKSAGLDDSDIKQAIPILAHFKVEYKRLIDDYNQKVVEANAAHKSTDFEGLIFRRDELVESTRDALKRVISPDSMARFDEQVQIQKRNMKVSKEAR
jgi:hypothetical protein